jgi:hypothetical protein
MQIAFASRGSRNAATNEDFVAATARVVVVLDGASAPPGEETGCVHGTPWFVRRLGAALLDIFESQTRQAPSDDLAQAIVNVNALHINMCDLAHPGTPSAAVAILREQGEMIEFLLLGEATLLLDEPPGIRVVIDDRLKRVATADQAALVQLGTGSSSQGSNSAVRAGHAVHRRDSDGLWGASTNPNAADRALTGTIHRRELRRAAVLTDGAARLADYFRMMDWPSFLDLLDRGGPEALIERLRDVERSDPRGQRWPRVRVHDDATAVLCHFSGVS